MTDDAITALSKLSGIEANEWRWYELGLKHAGVKP